MSLSREERERYRRQILIESIGEEGQKKLKSSSVFVVGSGGLGSPICLYLTAAGIGTIGIIDNDIVESSNLQRQVLHLTTDLGRPKTESAAETLKTLNPYVKVVTYQEYLTEENFPSILTKYDLVVNAVDNFPTRYLVNRVCVQKKKPLIEAGIHGFDGQIITIIPGKGPCYNCIFPERELEDREKKEIGVIGALPGIIGSLQALEAIKVILGLEGVLVGRLLLFNGVGLKFQELEIEQDPHCLVCREK